MGLSAISFSGISSGIDTTSIISELLAVDRQPEISMKNDIGYLQQRQTAYNQVSAALLGLQSTTSSLNSLRAFNLVTGTSSDETVATLTAATGTQPGTHTITVSNLATAQRISSSVQTSATTPLGFDGQIVVNGKAITVHASDTLTTLAQNINASQPGVSASVISPSANQFYLTLNSSNTGLQGKISISDTAGSTFLGTTLGLFGAGSTLKNAISATVAGSNIFTDSATSIATLEGQTSAPPTTGTVSITATVAGVPTTQSVVIDLNKSLSGIASDINAAFGGPAVPVAQVVSVTNPVTGTAGLQLQLNGVTGAGSLTDNNNVLANLGVLQKNLGVGRELTAALDANFTLDGLAATRATNSFSDAITDVTINLLKDTGTTNLTISSDTSTIKSNVKAFVTAFNSAVDAVESQATYDPSSGATGALFGDGTTASIVNTLIDHATSQLSGLPSSSSLLSQIGITLDTGDHLQIDDAALTAALTTNLNGVAQLFQAYGAPTDPSVQFVSATGDTQPSGALGYAVNVTTAASQAILTAGTAQTLALASDETLTFAGPAFGVPIVPSLVGGHTLSLHAGSSITDVASQVNGDPLLSKVLTATVVGSKLTFTSKQYGSAAELAVISSIPDGGAGNTSGIGTTALDQKGVDVAGTINGEASTGIGQFLTDSLKGSNGSPNGRALGLQLRVTATAPGTYGTVTFTSGVANQVNAYINTQTDSFSGALTTAVAGLQSNIDDIHQAITDLESNIKDHQTTLQQQFTAMEVAVARIKSASAGLSQLGITASSNSGTQSR